MLRSRSYLMLLAVAAIIGVPVSALAFGFLALVSHLQGWIFTSLPKGLGFHGEPLWWPLPALALAGVLVALAIRFLPGTGGHSPADGFKAGAGAPSPAELPGVVLAALAGLSLGVVLGPEAPLIALGGGLGLCAVRLSRRPVPPRAGAVVAAAGSFAAISTLLGSPLVGAFLLMEASGFGGATLELVLLPGLLAAGVGSLIFIGLGTWTGLGTYSLGLSSVPHFARPDVAEFGWALVMGLAAAALGIGIRRSALRLRPLAERRMLLGLPAAGLAVAGLAIAFGAGTSKSTSEVLFSGQSALDPLISHSTTYTVGALALLLTCKGLAYAASLSSFRGGPVFPSLFLGAAGGMLFSHLPGLPLVPAVAIGMSAMCAVMLRLPITCVLLVALLLAPDSLAVTPLAIVAVIVAYVAATRLEPAPAQAQNTEADGTGPPAPTRTAQPGAGQVPASPTRR